MKHFFHVVKTKRGFHSEPPLLWLFEHDVCLQSEEYFQTAIDT